MRKTLLATVAIVALIGSSAAFADGYHNLDSATVFSGGVGSAVVVGGPGSSFAMAGSEGAAGGYAQASKYGVSANIFNAQSAWGYSAGNAAFGAGSTNEATAGASSFPRYGFGF